MNDSNGNNNFSNSIDVNNTIQFQHLRWIGKQIVSLYKTKNE